MPSIINTNISSLTAQRNLSTSQASLATSMQRLSSGMRINSAKDDAAGLAISERMTTQIRGSNQAARNANDGISLAQTAEGDLSQISSNLQRMRELAVQSANATNSSSDRAALDAEVQALSSEIDRAAQNSSFNGNKLLDGSSLTQTFQVGANGTSSDQITISSIASARTSALGGYTTAVTGGATTAALVGGGDLVLNGVTVGASVLTATPGQSAASAYSIATAINAVSGQSGVSATAQATTVAGVAPAASGVIAPSAFQINGVNVGGVAAGGTVAQQGVNVAAAINLVAPLSGVTASANVTTGVITLTAVDGRDIIIGGTVTNTGLTAATTHGTVNLASTSSAGITVAGTAVASAGLAVGTTAGTASYISSMNVLTASAATAALGTIDGALTTVNASRAALGAIQNRFTSVVASLQTTSENLTASRSRITDADFAAETANLSRSQILQQAGTAMVAQANQMPQGVLALLK
jgi:flagellin